MPISFRREAPLLFVGDIFFLIVSLWATLFVRYASIPAASVFYTHLVAFSFLFALSALVFLIAGLYDKHTLLFKSTLPETIFYAQIANVILGATFFFLIPYFGIQPKTNLVIYLVLSTLCVSLWRVVLFPRISVSAPLPALLVGDEDICGEVMREINGNTRYDIRFESFQSTEGRPPEDVRKKILGVVREGKVSAVVLPFSLLRERGLAGESDTLALSGVNFIDLESVYESLFDRVALPLLDDRWFIEADESAPALVYDIFKRGGDMLLSAIALLVASPLLLIVALALYLQGGSAFIFQKRIGKGSREIAVIKFRTMLYDDGEDAEKKKHNRITSFGALLRKTQIDEIPQFWNVLRGDLSLIGPRPEIPHFVSEYEHTIPYYEARHFIQPGISGWAQIKHASPPKFKLDIEATKAKLSYDLYYLKHRSLLLDVEITLRTIKILLAHASR